MLQVSNWQTNNAASFPLTKDTVARYIMNWLQTSVFIRGEGGMNSCYDRWKVQSVRKGIMKENLQRVSAFPLFRITSHLGMVVKNIKVPTADYSFFLCEWPFRETVMIKMFSRYYFKKKFISSLDLDHNFHLPSNQISGNGVS